MRALRSRAAVAEVLALLEARHGRPRYVPRFTPMDELVSCILSQSSSDASSFPTFTRLCERYPRWEDVVAAPVDELADTIRAAGLANQKAKAIQGSLRQIYAQFGAYELEALRSWPTQEAMTWLQTLPGVGPKTAAIVLCFALGRQVVPVDTHVYRVAWRLGIVPEGLGELKAHGAILRRTPLGEAYHLHVAFIQHGRTLCRALRPDCLACPVSAYCRWFQKRAKVIA